MTIARSDSFPELAPPRLKSVCWRQPSMPGRSSASFRVGRRRDLVVPRAVALRRLHALQWTAFPALAIIPYAIGVAIQLAFVYASYRTRERRFVEIGFACYRMLEDGSLVALAVLPLVGAIQAFGDRHGPTQFSSASGVD